MVRRGVCGAVLFAALGFVGVAGHQDLGGMQDVVSAQEGAPPDSSNDWSPVNDWSPGSGGQQDDGPIPPGNEW